MKKQILAAAFVLCCSVSFSQWTVQNPKPTGDNLLSVRFINSSTGYATGEAGNIIKTTDGGQNWILQKSGFSLSLYSQYCINDSISFAVGQGLTILKTSNGGNDWVKIKSGSGDINSIWFIDDSTGFVVTSGGNILKTTNTGSSWISKLSKPTSCLHSVFFIGKDTGYVCGNGGVIMKTIDAGETWDSLNTGTTAMLTSIFFADANKGCALSYNNVYITYNGGLTWNMHVTGASDGLSSIFFTDTATGYAVGDRFGAIEKTVDGGIHWTLQKIGTFYCLKSIYFLDKDTGYITGELGLIYKTTDAGNTWVCLSKGGAYELLSINFPEINTGYAVGEWGTMLRTVNAGNTWTVLPDVTSHMLNSVYFTDASTGYAVGEGGLILKTINSGDTWTKKVIDSTITYRSVFFIDANTGYITGDNGTVLKTTNAGKNWTAQVSHTPCNVNSIFFIDQSVGYAVGDCRQIIKTTNGGITWTPQVNPSNSYLYSVYFLDAETGFAVGGGPSFFDGATILKTADGGSTWTIVYSQPQGTFNSVYFITSNLGYAIWPTFGIYKTEDGGNTWAQMPSTSNTNLFSMCASSPFNLYFAGSTGVIMKFESNDILDISPDTLFIPASTKDTFTFNITSGSLFQITNSQSWLDVSPIVGKNFMKIHVTASANTDTSKRIATLLVTLKDLFYTKTVTVIQEGAPYVSMTSNAIRMKATVDTSAVLPVASNTKWYAGSSESWLIVSPDSGSKSGSIILSALPNASTSERSAIVTLSGTGFASILVTVKQAGLPYLSIGSNELYFGATYNTIALLSIESNTDWQVNSYPSWVTVSQLTGSNNGTLIVTAAFNPDTALRSDTIIISTTGTGTKNIITIQPGLPYLSTDKEMLSLPSTASDDSTFMVTSNTSWQVISSQWWLSVNPSAGTNSHLVALDALENSESTQRSAVVFIFANGIFTKSLSVSQAGSIINSIGNVNSKDQSFSVFPVPTSDKLIIQIRSNLDNHATLQIFDLMGKQLYSTGLSSGTRQMELHLKKLKLTQGIYYIKLVSTNKQSTARIIIK